MYRIVLVDDDRSILQGLGDSIEWEDLGIRVVGEATNGREALRLVGSLNPHIVITDIRMPVMDGIQLITHLAERKERICVVVLSAHDDFEFVRDAMRLGAENYLLKPISAEELRQTLLAIIERLEKMSLAAVNSPMQPDVGERILRNHVFYRLVKDEITIHELDDRLRFLGIDSKAHGYRVLYMDHAKEPDLSIGGSAVDTGYEALEQFCMGRSLVPFIDDHGNIAISLPVDPGTEAEDRLTDEIADVVEEIRSRSSSPAFVSLGPRVNSIRDLSVSYRGARACLASHLLGSGPIVVFDEVFGSRSVSCDAVWAAIDRRSVVGSGDGWSLERIRLRATELHADETSDRRAEVLSMLAWLEESVAESPQGRDVFSRDVGDGWKQIPEMQKSSPAGLLQILQRAVACVETLGRRHYSQNVAYLIHEAQDHYSDANLCLKAVAAEFNINPTHLGRRFRIETGSYFSDYLNGRRVERAAWIIEKTPQRLSDVSEAVGFSSVNYFYRVFKKLVGVTPTEFRRRAP